MTNPTPPTTAPAAPEPEQARRRLPLVQAVILVGVALLLLIGGLLFWRASAGVNDLALNQTPKGVTVVEARAARYQPVRRYVGTVEPWVQAKVGPQMISAYVDTVLVRPGAEVKRGEVIATLDCRTASATNKAVAMQARAVEAIQAAIAKEASRVSSLLDGGFVSPNEVEQKRAESANKQAQMLALQAQMLGTSLQVGDCVLRAPFDGEIGERSADPGAFVRPGSAIATVLDRRMVRVTADVPEEDFEAVAPGTPVRIHLLSTGKDLVAIVTRRAPSADPGTRTAHLEIDVADPNRIVPVWTTAELSIDVGQPIPATEVPLAAATVRGSKATVFVANGDTAHAVTAALLGERAGQLYLAPSFKAGNQVVTEGRAALNDGDKVAAKTESVAEPAERRTQLASPAPEGPGMAKEKESAQ